MKTTVKCYAYNLTDEPFLTFECESAEEAQKILADKVSWRDYVNDIWVKIDLDSLLYDPMLHIFKDWNGYRFVNISNERLAHYYF